MRHTDGVANDVVYRINLAYTGTPPTATQLTTLAAVATTAWGANLKSTCSAAVTLTECDILDLNSLSGASGTSVVSIAGTRAGSGLPANCAALVNFHIARRYRGGKPRIYVPYGTINDTLNQQSWTGAFTAALLTGYNAWVAAIVAAPWAGGTLTNQVNVSYYQGFTVVTNPITGRAKNVAKLRVGVPVQDVVQSVSVNPTYASQRRRNRP